jgi:nicotinamidase-related amidase
MTTPSQAPWWAELFDGDEASAYRGMGGAVRRPLGRKPAVLVIDVVRAFTGDEGQSLAEAIADFPTSCGPNAWVAMPQVKRVIELGVENEWPLIYTVAEIGAAGRYGGTVKGDGGAMGSPMDKPGAQDIPKEIAPPAGALVMPKPKASAFFSTSLPAYLLRNGVDSLIVTGSTTSGCVRATVIDGHSYGYPVFVVEDACFDRARLSHGVNLYEMNAKYADVLTADALTELAAAAS